MVDKPASPWYYVGATGGIVDTTAVDLQAVASATGQKYWLTNLQFANSATASEITILNKTGSVVLWRGYAPTGGAFSWVEFDPPLQSLAADILQVKMVTTASATRVSAQGFIDP